MKYMILFLIGSILFFACSDTNDANTNIEFLDERLSAAVTYAYSEDKVVSFLEQPSKAYVSAYFNFPADLPIDVIFGLDIEWFEGVNNSIHVPGGDWMAFAGFTQTGHLWVPVGSPENLTGTPTFAENFEVFDPLAVLEPETWYKMTITCDYATRMFVSVALKGENVDVIFDLSEKQLEYPNYVNFDKSTLTIYCFASRSTVLSGDDKTGNTKVYFDDMEAGIWNGASYDVILSNGFEIPNEISTAPYDFSLDVNPLHLVEENIWYSENPEALLQFVNNNVRSGSYALECNASLIK